jgi:hypothetical protein
MATFDFTGQIEPFKYLLIGKDNLIWGYGAQPGPIYSNIRIYVAGEVNIDETPPAVECASLVSDTLVRILFDEPLDNSFATNIDNYSISPMVAVQSASLDANLFVVDLKTAPHPLDQTFTLNITGVADSCANLNTLDTTIVYEYPSELVVSNISKENYYLAEKSVGDSIYSDRDYAITSIPAALAGYKWIVTANDDKQSPVDSFLTFCINKTVPIVIGYDKGIETIPDWLAGWQLTSYEIESEDAEYACYQKEGTPCEITIGGNSGTSSASMYLILIGDELEIDTTPPAAPTGLEISRF